MGRLTTLPNSDEQQVAKELQTAGYYSYDMALQVVNYWKGQGLTYDDIRDEYSLGGVNVHERQVKSN